MTAKVKIFLEIMNMYRENKEACGDTAWCLPVPNSQRGWPDPWGAGSPDVDMLWHGLGYSCPADVWDDYDRFKQHMEKFA